MEVAGEIGGQFVGGRVAARPVLLQAAHHDPVEIAADAVDQLRRGSGAPRGGGRQRLAPQRAQAGGGFRRLHFPNTPAHLVESRLRQLLRCEGRPARQQLVEQHPERIDVAAGVDVEAAQLRLLRAHVRRRADELLERREHRLVGEPALRRLRDAEIDHLGHRLAILESNEDVRGLDVTVDDPLLVGVLEGVADRDEQLQPRFGRKPVSVAVGGDLLPPHQFHHKIGAALCRGSRIEHPGDVRVIHQCQRLPLGLEPGDNLPRVHAELDHLQGHLTFYRLLLLGHPHRAAAALANLFDQFVAADHGAGRFGRRGPARGGVRHFLPARRWRSLQKVARGLVRPQQRFDPQLQLNGLAAGLADKCRPLRHRQRQRCGEKLLFLAR